MWLVFTENNDPSGAWLTQGLAQRGFARITQLARRDLCQLRTWEYSSDLDGAWFQMELAGGQRIDSREVEGVINRLQAAPGDRAVRGETEAQEGLGSPEMAPALRACLTSFSCPVWNPADLRSMHGGWRHVSEWVQLANQAQLPGLARQFVERSAGGLRWLDEGTPVEASRLSMGKVLVVGSRVVAMAMSPEAPEEIAFGCVRLAEQARTPLLEVSFYVDEDERWFFRSANTCPNLSTGGNQVLDVIAQGLLRSSALSARLEVS